MDDRGVAPLPIFATPLLQQSIGKNVNLDRRNAKIPARLIVEEGEPLHVLITNLSRGGCRVEPTPIFRAAREIRIEVDGWPRLKGRSVWSADGMTGCIFDPKPSETLYERMRERTIEDDRIG
jgi:hypothetical protein